MRKAGVQLVSGMGGITYGVEGMMDATVSLKFMTLGIPREIYLRDLECNDLTTDLIIGQLQFSSLTYSPFYNAISTQSYAVRSAQW